MVLIYTTCGLSDHLVSYYASWAQSHCAIKNLESNWAYVGSGHLTGCFVMKTTSSCLMVMVGTWHVYANSISLPPLSPSPPKMSLGPAIVKLWMVPWVVPPYRQCLLYLVPLCHNRSPCCNFLWQQGLSTKTSLCNHLRVYCSLVQLNCCYLPPYTIAHYFNILQTEIGSKDCIHYVSL